MPNNLEKGQCCLTFIPLIFILFYRELSDTNTLVELEAIKRLSTRFPLFSKQVFLSGVIVTGLSSMPSEDMFHTNKLEYTIVPFQSGSKPGGISALQVDKEGILKLTFLHPSEAELLSIILDMEKKVDYEKLSTFKPEEFIDFVINETQSYIKEKIEDGSIKAKLKSTLLDQGCDKKWADQVITSTDHYRSNVVEYYFRGITKRSENT